MMRSRWLVGAVLVAAAVGVGLPQAAFAQDPVELTGDRVTDDAAVLSPSDAERVEVALDTLYDDTGMDLFVVYVDQFTNPSDAASWADTTADLNNMGTNDYLLAVATEGRSYYLSVAADAPMTDEQLAEINADRIEPALHAEEWADAAIAAATGLATVAEGSGGSSSGLIWFLLIAVIVVGIVVFVMVRRRRKTALVGPDLQDALPIADLARTSGSALVNTDDAVKTSEQELGFAIASYGAEATAEFSTVLEQAKAALSQAFALKQKLDDAEPDTEQEQRAWHGEILSLCEQANAALDAQAEAFDALRDLEKHAPEALGELQQNTELMAARIPAAEQSLSALAANYTNDAFATVNDNINQATERLAFARTAGSQAAERLAMADAGGAAVGVQAGTEAVGQAGLLLDAIDRVAADLAEAQGGLAASIADLQSDLVAARALAQTPEGATANLPGVIAATEHTIAVVTALAAETRTNPLDLMQRLEQANQVIDGQLGGVRDAQATAQRARAALDSTLLTARSQVSAAEDFVTARRGGVGADARTRLAEAGRLLVTAQERGQSDPAGALADAQRANQLAAQSIELARRDVSDFSMPGQGSSGGDMMGAILGGILINTMLGGGGRSSGGFFPGGSSGGRRGSGGGFRSPGSFGGSGTRSRRGGGGRF